MKKYSIVLLLAATAFACSRNTIKTSETKVKTETTTTETKVKTETPAPAAPDANAALVAAGQTVYTNRCGRCHNLKPVEAYTPAAWENILKSMIPKAKLNEEESKQVTAYVMANAKK